MAQASKPTIRFPRMVANLRPGNTLQVGNVSLTFADAALIRSCASTG